MLTPEQYEALWIHTPNEINSFATITGIEAPPANDEYVIRENMFQDYLDIFRGVNTRGDIVIRPQEPGEWYYEHPFFNANGISLLEETPCIYNVLIGEAAPKKKGKEYKNDLKPHEYLTYIYNVEIPGGGQYITSILNAFNVKKIDKISTKERLSKIIDCTDNLIDRIEKDRGL